MLDVGFDIWSVHWTMRDVLTAMTGMSPMAWLRFNVAIGGHAHFLRLNAWPTQRAHSMQI